MFASKVQPILMNACLGCHTAGRGGKFQLIRVSEPGLGNRRSLEQNLAATLAEVNTQQPLLSRLLSKAVSVHGSGMTQAPMKNRQAPAYRALEKWVTLTLENNPQLREQALASTPALPLPPLPASTSHWGVDRGRAPASPRPVVAEKPAREPAVTKTSPAPPSTPAAPAGDDPVDPQGFNREFHPGRTQDR
jgi:hypothetical protein